jgi:hypothetical protein
MLEWSAEVLTAALWALFCAEFRCRRRNLCRRVPDDSFPFDLETLLKPLFRAGK